MSHMWKAVKEIKVKIRYQYEIILNPVCNLLSGSSGIYLQEALWFVFLTV